MKQSKNDIAWEKLFEKYNILKEIETNDTFSIKAEQINEFREARLMTKFDHSSQLPKLFSDNKISILPNSRGNYILGKFKIFEELKYSSNKDNKAISVKMPDFIQSIDVNNITSESIALNVAHMTNMIDSVIDSPNHSLLTLNGRMSSGLLDYKISTISKKSVDFSVNNAQIEIDGSYESLNKIAVLEAKNKIPLDFNIRQLYYPFRLYHSLNTTKEIVPIFFTYADEVFSFHIYDFKDVYDYSSIKKIKQVNFILNDSLNLTLDEVKEISYKVKEVPEDCSVPFPQADTFARVLDMLDYLSEPKNKIDLAESYEFDIRQSDYYANCLVYLGLATKEKQAFVLNSEGIKLKNMHNSNKRNKLIIEKILSHKPFKLAFDSTLKNYGTFDRQYISDVLLKFANNVNSKSTADRRTSTVTSWLNWIFSVID